MTLTNIHVTDRPTSRDASHLKSKCQNIAYYYWPYIFWIIFWDGERAGK